MSGTPARNIAHIVEPCHLHEGAWSRRLCNIYAGKSSALGHMYRAYSFTPQGMSLL